MGTVRLTRFGLRGRVILPTIFRGRARMDERFKALRRACPDEICRPLEVRPKDFLVSPSESLDSRASAIENPLRPDRSNDSVEGVLVGKVGVGDPNVGQDVVHAPGPTRGSHQKMNFVSVREQTTGNVTSDEPRGTSDENALHRGFDLPSHRAPLSSNHMRNAPA